VSEPVNLFAQQEANRRRSKWLVAGFILFFAWLGFGGDLIAYLATKNLEPEEYHHTIPFLGLVMMLIAVGIVSYSRKHGAERVLWSCGAVEILEPKTDEEKVFINVLEEMSIASGLPRPRAFVVRDDDPNAFATGQSQQTACVAVTDGLLKHLNRDELQAVVAHEMGHVKNLDMQLMTLLAAMVGVVALMSDGMARIIFHGGMRGGRRGSGGGGGGKKNDLGPLVIILLVVWLISWMLAPLVTQLMAMGVSRRREYLADAMSAQFTRNPGSLASALEKIEHVHGPTHSIKRGAAHLCIADPLGRKVNMRTSRFADIFATHPPMPNRIARLKEMSYQTASAG
jgi:heat shock protein HtpX